MKTIRRKVPKSVNQAKNDRLSSLKAGAAAANRATTSRILLTLFGCGVLLIVYALCFKLQIAGMESQSNMPLTRGSLSKKLDVLFATGFIISVTFLLRRPSILFGLRILPENYLGLPRLEEFVDRTIRLRTLRGQRNHRGVLILSAALGSVLLGFSFYAGLIAIHASLLEGYPVRSIAWMYVLTALPPAWIGGKVIWKAKSWTDNETQAAIQRDELRELRELRDQSEDSVFGTPYVMFIICFLGGILAASRDANEARGTCMFLASLIGFVTGGAVSYLMRRAPRGWPVWVALVLIGSMIELSYLNSAYSPENSVKPALALGLAWGGFFGLITTALYVRKTRKRLR